MMPNGGNSFQHPYLSCHYSHSPVTAQICFLLLQRCLPTHTLIERRHLVSESAAAPYTYFGLPARAANCFETEYTSRRN